MVPFKTLQVVSVDDVVTATGSDAVKVSDAGPATVWGIHSNVAREEVHS